MKVDQKALELSLEKQRSAINKMLVDECHMRYVAKKICEPGKSKIVQGIKGAGKTFTTIHAIDSLGVPYAYVDLSDRALRHLNLSDYLCLIEGVVMLYGKIRFVVLDEFLTHENWRRCFDAFHDNGIEVIGLTSISVNPDDVPDYASILNFYPLSFSEYCLWHHVDADCDSIEKKVVARKAFDDYMMRGGFPEFQSLSRPKSAATHLIGSIIKENIPGDFRKNATDALPTLAYYLLDHSPGILNYKRLAEILDIKSEITVKKYIEAIKRSNAFTGILKFAMRDKTRNISEKLYLADPVFLPTADKGKRLETIVYLQLRRFCERYGYFMHYYANRSAECDFALCNNRKMRTIIQVMANYDNPAAIKEKVAGLINLAKITGGSRLFILTDCSRDQINEKGLYITVMPAYEFLLNNTHLIIS